MTIIGQLAELLDMAESRGKRAKRLLIGHGPAAELEAALYRPAKTEYGLFGEVISEEPERPCSLPYPMAECATLFGVPIERADDPDRLGVEIDA